MNRPKRAGTLTLLQGRFAAEYIIDLDASASYVRAGGSPKNAKQNGYNLLQHPLVALAVKEALDRRSARVEVKADDVLRELVRLFSVDIGQAFDESGRPLPLHRMPEDVRRAIAGIEVEVLPGSGRELDDGGTAAGGATVTKLKLLDKTRAIEMAMRHLGLFKDKVEVSGTLRLEDLVPKRKKDE